MKQQIACKFCDGLGFCGHTMYSNSFSHSWPYPFLSYLVPTVRQSFYFYSLGDSTLLLSLANAMLETVRQKDTERRSRFLRFLCIAS